MADGTAIAASVGLSCVCSMRNALRAYRRNTSHRGLHNMHAGQLLLVKFELETQKHGAVTIGSAAAENAHANILGQ